MNKLKSKLIGEALAKAHSPIKRAKLLIVYNSAIAWLVISFLGLPLLVMLEQYPTLATSIMGMSGGVYCLLRLGSKPVETCAKVLIVTGLVSLYGSHFNLGGIPHITTCGFYFTLTALAALVLGARWGVIIGGFSALAMTSFLVYPYFDFWKDVGEGVYEDTGIPEFLFVVTYQLGFIIYIISAYVRINRETVQELDRARLLAEEASQAKEDFMSTLSHEIRTPLNAVVGNSHILAMSAPRDDQKELVQNLEASAENLLLLADRILDYNKIKANQIVLERGELNVKELANRIVQSFQVSGRDEVMLSCVIDSTIPDALVGDSARLAQVFNNFLSNAIKFTEKGFVRISLECLNLTSANVKIRFMIEDSGLGIPEQKLEHIFEPFQQIATPAYKKSEGAGLGLAITKKIIELHGGAITATSVKGEGSKFSFDLEFEIGKAQDQSVTTKKERDFSSFRALVFEDNEMNQLVIQKFLSKWGIESTVVGSGEEGVELIQRETFDLVFMDLHMPGIDGYESAGQIRKLGFEQIPIIAFSADASDGVRQKVLDMGMNGYLPKPFDPEDLKAILSAVVI